MVLAADGGDTEPEGLKLFDASTLPDKPPRSTFYRHRVPLPVALVRTWQRREVVVALAERDVRASYKQAALGMAWALVSPILQITIFTIVFSRVKAFHVHGVPYSLYAFVGLMCWSYFAGSFSAGGSSIIGSIALLNKTHFPRECFPLAQMLEQALYTAISIIPLTMLMIILRFPPHIEILWSLPILVVIEVMFTIGMTLAFAALIVYIRDLGQISSIITQLGLFATPVIWPLYKLQDVNWGPFHHANLEPIYSFINPLAPVIDSARRTFLQGLPPDWNLLGIASVSAFLYFVIGYSIFKRLEVGFADIS